MSVPVETHRFVAGDVSLALHAWSRGGAPSGAARPVLLCHPTGFHGRIWHPVARRLAEAGCAVWSFDFRGHGDSDVPDAAYRWDDFAADVLAVVEHLGLPAGRMAGVGHSKGAAALVLAESGRPGTFERLWLYEPIIFPSDPPLGPTDANPLVETARRRREVFDSRDEAYENFATKPPLDALCEEALRAYVDHGLRVRDDGCWELKCPGEIEARVYAMGSAHAGYRALAEVACPSLVVCGEHTQAIRPEWGQDFAARLPAGRFALATGLGHFGPLEDPDAMTASILGFLDLDEP